MVREGRANLPDVTEGQSLRARAGTALIEKLPAFPHAPIEAIFEARDDLAEPLMRYRKAMRAVSEGLASGPFDLALDAEVDTLWRDEVEPSLVELRRALSGTRIVFETARALVTDPKAVASGLGTGVLAFGVVANAAELGEAAGASGIASAGVGALTQGVGRALDRRAEAKRHDLYYLLAANDALR